MTSPKSSKQSDSSSKAWLARLKDTAFNTILAQTPMADYAGIQAEHQAKEGKFVVVYDQPNVDSLSDDYVVTTYTALGYGEAYLYKRLAKGLTTDIHFFIGQDAVTEKLREYKNWKTFICTADDRILDMTEENLAIFKKDPNKYGCALGDQEEYKKLRITSPNFIMIDTAQVKQLSLEELQNFGQKLIAKPFYPDENPNIRSNLNRSLSYVP